MKFPVLFALLACTLQPAFAAIPVRVATVEQTAHAAERQIPAASKPFTPLSYGRARKARSPKSTSATGST